jgi:nucleoside-diphosphate-sugar epimerase
VARRILVTGGAGYIGSCVVEELLGKGYAVTVLDSFNWGDSPLQPYADRITLLRGDIRHAGDVMEALEGVDAVIHLAGIVGAPACAQNPNATFTTNVESTRTLVNCMTDPEVGLVRDLVFCSSCSVYGNVYGLYDEVHEGTPTMPLSEYAASKLRGERIIFDRAEQVPHFSPTVLRLTTIFGWSPRPRFDLVTNAFVERAYREGRITVYGGGQQYRSLIHVRDVASALVRAVDSPRYMRDRAVFHVGDDANNVAVAEIARTVAHYLPDTRIEFPDEQAGDRRDYRINCQRIRNTLNWQARYSVSAGIEELVDRLRAGAVDPVADAWHNDRFTYR